GSLSGILSGDNVTFTTNGSFSDKNAGIGKTVNVGFSTGGTDAGNYAVTANTTTTANIDRLAVSGSLQAQDKIYDATKTAGVMGSLSGVLSGDQVNLTAQGSFADKNVGADKSVTFSAVSLSGADALNYSVSTNTTATATISALDITGQILADSKVYDGTILAQTTGTLNGVPVGPGIAEDVSLATVGAFADIHAGTGLTVNVSGFLAGADAGNYRLVSSNAQTQADIFQRQLTVTPSLVFSKVYDGNVAAQVGAGRLVGVLGLDQVIISSATGQFADRHVGANKAVQVSYNLGGASAGDYFVPAEQLTGSITPKALQIAGSAAADKVYDGSTQATVTAGSLSGLVAGDSVGVSGNGQFADKRVGADKSVSVTYSLTGAESLDYTLAGETLLADITPKALSISGSNALDKVYDATTDAQVIAGTLAGKVGGDDVMVGATGVFADKNAGVNKQVTAGYTLFGTDAANYTLAGQTLQASITPADLTIKANDATKVAGTENPAFTININEFVIGDNLTGLSGNSLFNAGTSTDLSSYVSGLNGTLSFQTPATTTSAPGTYAITPTGLTAPNYTIHFQPGQLTVIAAASGGQGNETPPANNPSFSQDPADGNPPPPPPQDMPGGEIGGTGSQFVLLGGGVQMPGGQNDDDDDDQNTL
ncbi:hypothetical protein EV700_3023, partial [Fluviicoccus keumensis]